MRCEVDASGKVGGMLPSGIRDLGLRLAGIEFCYDAKVDLPRVLSAFSIPLDEGNRVFVYFGQPRLTRRFRICRKRPASSSAGSCIFPLVLLYLAGWRTCLSSRD